MTVRPLDPRKAPRQERSRLTVDAIVEAAARVFERDGYAAGTTNRIAERAGVSVGSLYQYFPNKDAILVALVERHVEEGAAVLQPMLLELQADPPPLRDGLRRVTAGMVALHRDRPALHRVLFEEAPRPPALQARLDDLLAAGTAALAAYLRASPEVAVADVDLAARLAVQVIEGVTHQCVIHPEPEWPADTWIAATVDMLYAYLTASG